MIVWMNGAFGSGKTSVCEAIVKRDAGYRIFDPETVGFMLRHNLAGIPMVDFQDLPAWRTLVPLVARELTATTGQTLVLPQTVLRLGYWRELLAGFTRVGLGVFHVVLDAEREELVDRIRGDRRERGAKQWRMDHLDGYANARDWLRQEADLFVPTGTTEPRVLAGVVLNAVAARTAVQP